MTDMSTFILILWESEEERGFQPNAILGPFTMAQAERVRMTLTCPHDRWRINTDVPEWAQ